MTDHVVVVIDKSTDVSSVVDNDDLSSVTVVDKPPKPPIALIVLAGLTVVTMVMSFASSSDYERPAWRVAFCAAGIVLFVATNACNHQNGDSERFSLAMTIMSCFMLYVGMICLPTVRDRHASWFTLGCFVVTLSAYIVPEPFRES